MGHSLYFPVCFTILLRSRHLAFLILEVWRSQHLLPSWFSALGCLEAAALHLLRDLCTLSFERLFLSHVVTEVSVPLFHQCFDRDFLECQKLFQVDLLLIQHLHRCCVIFFLLARVHFSVFLRKDGVWRCWLQGCAEIICIFEPFSERPTAEAIYVSSLDLLGHGQSCCLLVLCMATFPCAGTSLKLRCFPQWKDGIVQWVCARALENGWNAGLTRDRDGWDHDNTCNNICPDYWPECFTYAFHFTLLSDYYSYPCWV